MAIVFLFRKKKTDKKGVYVWGSTRTDDVKKEERKVTAQKRKMDVAPLVHVYV